MAETYDVGVIGAGADGLSAAAMLARAGLKTIVIEKADRPGGRLRVREFHPGFFANPVADTVAPVPSSVAWDLALARRGAIFIPDVASVAVWPDRRHVMARKHRPAILREAETLARGVVEHALRDAAVRPKRRWFSRAPKPDAWPGEGWAPQSLDWLLGDQPSYISHHVMGLALAGRAADPYLAGSGLQLMLSAFGGAGQIAGGTARLADALGAAAREAGAEIACGLDVTDIRHDGEQVRALVLADGTEIAVRFVISTLDLKRTMLSLFTWDALPDAAVDRAGAYRMGGGTARLLLALDAPPDLTALGGDPALARAPVHLAPTGESLAAGHAAWRAGMIPDYPPVTVRLVSATDPSAAPRGKAALTVTLGCIPFRLFDGAWTKEKRDRLRDRALAAIDAVFPGIGARLLAVETIAPPDIEDMLGLTGGDLWGGDIAADQMFATRPWIDGRVRAPRTPMKGLYLAGPSTPAGPVAACASGVVAATAVLADRKAGAS